jgi:rsbT antagonist protein RsbS
MKVPILRHGNVLLTSFQDDLTDRDAIDLQIDLLDMIERTDADAVLMDVSSLEAVDSYQAKMLSETAAMTRLLGCDVVLSGVQPKVAMTLVELGDVLAGVQTVLNLEQGLDRLQPSSEPETPAEDQDTAAEEPNDMPTEEDGTKQTADNAFGMVDV